MIVGETFMIGTPQIGCGKKLSVTSGAFGVMIVFAIGRIGNWESSLEIISYVM